MDLVRSSFSLALARLSLFILYSIVLARLSLVPVLYCTVLYCTVEFSSPSSLIGLGSSAAGGGRIGGVVVGCARCFSLGSSSLESPSAVG